MLPWNFLCRKTATAAKLYINSCKAHWFLFQKQYASACMLRYYTTKKLFVNSFFEKIKLFLKIFFAYALTRYINGDIIKKIILNI